MESQRGYFKTNIQVLKFDNIKDTDKIIFNHYIMKKVNYNNMNGNLPKGQFYISNGTVSKDLNISIGKAKRLIKNFKELNIIQLVQLGNTDNTPSVYEYSNNIDLGHDLGHNLGRGYTKASNSNNLCLLKEHTYDKGDNIENCYSKKDNINNNKIHSCVVDYLNKKTGKRFKKTSVKTKILINARLNEGFDEEDFYKVINIKSKQWLHTEMEKYLRPETLFSNKFEGYLNEEVDINEDIEDLDDIKPFDIEFDF
nr:conserved phage C-terminal domain-containing protein [uncultured Romboutsia sp.]